MTEGTIAAIAGAIQIVGNSGGSPSLQDLTHLVMAPLVALAIAGVVVWTGNRRTARLDAEIKAYREKRAAERRGPNAD